LDASPGASLAELEEQCALIGFLHSPSILFTAGFIGLVGSLLLARNSGYGRRARATPIPPCWLAAAMVQALASFGHALRGELPPAVAFSAVNAVQLLALGLLWVGARRMNGNMVPCWLAMMPPVIWLAACLVPGFMETRPLRLGLYAPLNYGAALWAALDLLAVHRRHRVRAARDMAIMVGLVALTLLTVVVPTIFAPAVPDSPQALFTHAPSLITALYGATLPFMMLAVAREWDSLEEGMRRLASLQAGRAEVERLHAGLPTVLFLSRVTIEGDEVRSQRLYRGGDTLTVLGWPPEELAGLPNLETIAEYGEIPMAYHFRMTAEAGEHGWQWRVRRKDGSWSWIRTRARRLAFLPDGSAEIVGYNVNIDREREAEARAMAAARMASLGEMAAGMAHEIKQPLQSISLAAEVALLAAHSGDAANVERRLGRIVEQTQRTAELIEQLRRFARGADDGAPPELVPLDAVVQAALDLTRSAMRDAAIRIEVALGDPAPVVRGQAVLLEQVISNLLINARDALATQHADAPRRIRIVATPGADGLVTLTVADTGGGIAPEALARIFEPFFTTKSPDKGTGLGLSICHGLVRGMGGSIEAHNEAAGAVFTIKLPSAATEDVIVAHSQDEAIA
jgi:signal transduction histidine kinase